MNQKELIRRIATNMRKNDKRKSVGKTKCVFHITDDLGHKKDFVVTNEPRGVLYTIDDVEAVISSCLDVIKEALKQGDNLTIKGFGTLGLQYRKTRRTIHPVTGEPVFIEGRYLPKFQFGGDLRACAKVYELSLEDKIRDKFENDEEDEDY